MTANNVLTLHILSALPWHNANRDDRGMPKMLTLGGAPRAMLSSQSLKRAARIAYEEASLDLSYRSAAHTHKLIADRAEEIATTNGATFDTEKALKLARNAVDSLVRAAAKEKVPTAGAGTTEEVRDKDTNVWLSDDEVDALAHAILEPAADGKTGKELATVVGVDRKVASLAIAAFGRMFAASPAQQTDAAIAVSPAVTTHRMVIETDYFTVVEDLNSTYSPDNKGASYLDAANFTSGVYYRTVTIDKGQLGRSWSSLGDPSAQARLELLIRALVLSLPAGKKTSTAAVTKPLIVLAEEQSSRCAYDFETPVAAHPDGGYGKASVQALLEQRRLATSFDPAGFGPATAAGTSVAAGDVDQIEGVDLGDLDDVVAHVVAWATS